MVYLSLDERINLAKTVVDQAAGRMCVVASGHISDSLEEQAREINLISQTGIDAFVLVSNRLDLHNDGDDVWIANAEKLLSMIDPDILLGVYECPYPYKRLLTPRIIDWCIGTGRFRFIKDTCCDPDMLTERVAQLKGTGLLLFNANAQTLLHSLRDGAAGYSGIMANFHPDLLAWVCDNFDKQPEKVEEIFNVLSMMAFTEALAYPCTAKYYLDQVGVSMTTESRSRDPKQLTNLASHSILWIGMKVRNPAVGTAPLSAGWKPMWFTLRMRITSGTILQEEPFICSCVPTPAEPAIAALPRWWSRMTEP
jgi:4-hydroxy-tetrahydrodipicolinate synthase